MIDASEVKAELAKIRALSRQAKAAFAQLQQVVIDDISKTGDSRTRNLMRMLSEFKL